MEGVPKRNPNQIGEVLSVGRDLPTTNDKVYRSVSGDAAIEDLFVHGEVRNGAAAKGKLSHRWGENVYWSRGADGKYHMVPDGAHVIEAPHDIAAERRVTRDDVTAIWSKNDEGVIENKLEELRAKLGLNKDT